MTYWYQNRWYQTPVLAWVPAVGLVVLVGEEVVALVQVGAEVVAPVQAVAVRVALVQVGEEVVAVRVVQEQQVERGAAGNFQPL